MRIYLDHNATTPLRESVVEAMVSILEGASGNPSSPHEEGADARRSLDLARAQVAECLGARPGEIIFTAGASEANNTLLRTAADRDQGRKHIVATTTEHPSVEEPIRWLEKQGLSVTRVPVDPDGLVDVDVLLDSIRDDTSLVSVIWANNETGVLQPMPEIARRVRSASDVWLHADATQAIGKIPIDFSEVDVDFMSCSAHKLNGPKGVGCLVARGELEIAPLILGGGQELGRRGGTENVAGIVGFGVAASLARHELSERMKHDARLRDRLWDGIRAILPVRRNGSSDDVLPNTLNLEFEGFSGEALLQALDLEGVAVSAGAACHSGAVTPSRVLTAMGRSAEQAASSLRFSVGLGVDEEQIDRVVALLGDIAARVGGKAGT